MVDRPYHDLWPGTENMSTLCYFDPSEATAHVDSLLMRYLARLKESEMVEIEALKQAEVQQTHAVNHEVATQQNSRFSETMLKEALIDMKEENESLQQQLESAFAKLFSEEGHRKKVAGVVYELCVRN